MEQRPASHPTRPGRPRRQRGIALIAVLWVLVLLALLAASFTRSTRTGAQLARNLVANAEARALADAGVYRAILGLLEAESGRRPAVDGTPYRIGFEAGEVLLTLQDEGGKIDLNRAPEKLLAGLLQAVELDENEAARLVDAILDYRDRDDARRPSGAENDEYRAAGLTYGAKNAPFEAIEELRQVLGMTGAVYRRIAPAITVHGRGRRVNQATAPPLVLRALPGLSESALERRIDDRTARADAPLSLGGGNDEAGEALEEDGETPTARRARRRRRAVAAVTVRAEAHTSKGATFVREAVVRTARRRVRRPGRELAPYEILAWRVGTREAAGGSREASEN